MQQKSQTFYSCAIIAQIAAVLSILGTLTGKTLAHPLLARPPLGFLTPVSISVGAHLLLVAAARLVDLTPDLLVPVERRLCLISWALLRDQSAPRRAEAPRLAQRLQLLPGGEQFAHQSAPLPAQSVIIFSRRRYRLSKARNKSQAPR